MLEILRVINEGPQCHFCTLFLIFFYLCLSSAISIYASLPSLIFLVTCHFPFHRCSPAALSSSFSVFVFLLFLFTSQSPAAWHPWHVFSPLLPITAIQTLLRDHWSASLSPDNFLSSPSALCHTSTSPNFESVLCIMSFNESETAQIEIVLFHLCMRNVSCCSAFECLKFPS